MAQPSFKASIEVQGARKLRKELNALNKEVAGPGMRKIHLDVAKIVADEATRQAPRRSGRLAGSVRGKSTTRRATISAGKGNVPYAGVIHWGWPRRNIRANRFLFRASGAKRDEAMREYSDGMNDLLRKLGL